MIIKAIKNTIMPKQHGWEGEYFFDGFDSIRERNVCLKDTEKPCTAYSSQWFTEEKTEKVIELMLSKNGHIVNYLVFDMSYIIYLMSDTGKTIEKLN